MKNDLISRSELKKKARHVLKSNTGGSYPAMVGVDDIDAAPAVEAVEVVRCRDCENWAGDPAKKPEYAGCWRYGAAHAILVHENGFCDKGKRREADEN